MAKWDDGNVDAFFRSDTFNAGVVPPAPLARFYLRLAEQLPLTTAPTARDYVRRCGCVDVVPGKHRDPALLDAIARVRKAIVGDPRLDAVDRNRAATALLKAMPATASRLLALDVGEPGVFSPALVWDALVRIIGSGESGRDRAGRRRLADAVVAEIAAAPSTSQRALLSLANWPSSLALLSDADVVDVVCALVEADVVAADRTWAPLLVRSAPGRMALIARTDHCDDDGWQLLLGALDVAEAVELVDEQWRAGRMHQMLRVAPKKLLLEERFVDLALWSLQPWPDSALRLLSRGGPRARRELEALARSADFELRKRLIDVAVNDVDLLRLLLEVDVDNGVTVAASVVAFAPARRFLMAIADQRGVAADRARAILGWAAPP